MKQTAKTCIVRCNCENKGQDNLYGPGNRVHNKIDKSMKHNQNNWRCSVCKNEKH